MVPQEASMCKSAVLQAMVPVLAKPTRAYSKLPPLRRIPPKIRWYKDKLVENNRLQLAKTAL